jgi:hypothetical protein
MRTNTDASPARRAFGTRTNPARARNTHTHRRRRQEAGSCLAPPERALLLCCRLALADRQRRLALMAWLFAAHCLAAAALSGLLLPVHVGAPARVLDPALGA